MAKGYDLFGDHGRNLPTPHGSGCLLYTSDAADDA